jgi:transketolase
MAAARYKLDNLIAVVDHNRIQQYGWPGDGPDGRIPPQTPGELVAKWSAFGWRVLEADGHDVGDLVRVLGTAVEGDGRPVVVIAHTVKGRGVSFMEGHWFWHTRAIKPEEFEAAMAELGEPTGSEPGGTPAGATGGPAR